MKVCFISCIVLLLGASTYNAAADEDAEPVVQQGSYDTVGVVNAPQLVVGSPQQPGVIYQPVKISPGPGVIGTGTGSGTGMMGNSASIVSLLRPILLLQLMLSFLSTKAPTTTSSTTTTTVTSGTTVTTDTTVTTEEITTPDTIKGWKHYKGCYYEQFTLALVESAAIAKCAGINAKAVIAQKNVRTKADRKALFGQIFGVVGTPYWLGLKDADGDVTTEDPKWFDGTVYVKEDGTTTKYNDGDFSQQAYTSGLEFEYIEFTPEGTSASFLCEYCP